MVCKKKHTRHLSEWWTFYGDDTFLGSVENLEILKSQEFFRPKAPPPKILQVVLWNEEESTFVIKRIVIFYQHIFSNELGTLLNNIRKIVQWLDNHYAVRQMLSVSLDIFSSELGTLLNSVSKIVHRKKF